MSKHRYLREEMKITRYTGIPTLVLFLAVFGGCALVGSVTKKRDSKFETTGLFPKKCKETRANGKINREKNLLTKNECNEVDLQRMVEAFGSIQEADPDRGIAGDSVENVVKKGFTVFSDVAQKEQRQGTEVLHGAEALAAVGMPVNPPQLNTPAEIDTYKKYMRSHFAWVFKETDLEGVVDRFYINTKNASTIGPDLRFIITFQGGRVFQRVVKGGPQNVITQEKAFLLGPGGFLLEFLTGTVNRGSNMLFKFK